jgi:hypothetical protein
VLCASQRCLCIAYIVGRVPITGLGNGWGMARDGEGCKRDNVVISLLDVSTFLSEGACTYNGLRIRLARFEIFHQFGLALRDAQMVLLSYVHSQAGAVNLHQPNMETGQRSSDTLAMLCR